MKQESSFLDKVEKQADGSKQKSNQGSVAESLLGKSRNHQQIKMTRSNMEHKKNSSFPQSFLTSQMSQNPDASKKSSNSRHRSLTGVLDSSKLEDNNDYKTSEKMKASYDKAELTASLINSQIKNLNSRNEAGSNFLNYQTSVGESRVRASSFYEQHPSQFISSSQTNTDLDFNQSLKKKKQRVASPGKTNTNNLKKQADIKIKFKNNQSRNNGLLNPTVQANLSHPRRSLQPGSLTAVQIKSLKANMYASQQNTTKPQAKPLIAPMAQPNDDKIIIKRIIQPRKSLQGRNSALNRTSLGQAASKDSQEDMHKNDAFFETRYSKEKKLANLKKVRAKSQVGLRPNLGLDQIRSQIDYSRNMRNHANNRVQSAINNITQVKSVYQQEEPNRFKESKARPNKISLKNRVLASGLQNRQKIQIKPINLNRHQETQANQNLEKQRFMRFAKELWQIVNSKDQAPAQEIKLNERNKINGAQFLSQLQGQSQVESIQILDSNLNIDISSYISKGEEESSPSQNSQEEASFKEESQETQTASQCIMGSFTDIPLGEDFASKESQAYRRAETDQKLPKIFAKSGNELSTINKRTETDVKKRETGDEANNQLNLTDLAESQEHSQSKDNKEIPEEDQLQDEIKLVDAIQNAPTGDKSKKSEAKQFEDLLKHMTDHCEQMPKDNNQVYNIVSNAVEQLKKAQDQSSTQPQTILPKSQQQQTSPLKQNQKTLIIIEEPKSNAKGTITKVNKKQVTKAKSKENVTKKKQVFQSQTFKKNELNSFNLVKSPGKVQESTKRKQLTIIQERSRGETTAQTKPELPKSNSPSNKINFNDAIVPQIAKSQSSDDKKEIQNSQELQKQQEKKINEKSQRDSNNVEKIARQTTEPVENIARQTTETGISLFEPVQTLVMITEQTFEPKSLNDQDQSSDSSKQPKVEETKQIFIQELPKKSNRQNSNVQYLSSKDVPLSSDYQATKSIQDSTFQELQSESQEAEIVTKSVETETKSAKTEKKPDKCSLDAAQEFDKLVDEAKQQPTPKIKLRKFNYKFREGLLEEYLKNYPVPSQCDHKRFDFQQPALGIEQIKECERTMSESKDLIVNSFQQNPRPQRQEPIEHSLDYFHEQLSQTFYGRFIDKKIEQNQNDRIITQLVRSILEEAISHAIKRKCRHQHHKRKNEYLEALSCHDCDKKLVQLYDLDFRNILDPKRKIKIYKYDKRQEDAEVLLSNAAEDEDETSYDMDFRFKLHSMIHQQQIFGNCAYAHFEFYPQMWFFAAKDLNIFELKIYSEFKTHKAYKKMQNFFNFTRTAGQKEILQIIKENKKDHKHQFLNLDKTRALDQVMSITLFDIKTKLSLFGLLSEIDFEKPESMEIKLDLRIQEHLKKCSLKTQSKINRLIQRNYETKKTASEIIAEDLLTFTQKINRMLVRIDQNTMDKLSEHLNVQLREIQIRFCIKTAVQSQEILRDINERLREEMYTKQEALMRFKEDKTKNDQRIENVEDKMESLQLTSSFKSYIEAIFTSTLDKYQFQHLLFKQNTTSLYRKLMYPHHDLILYNNVSIVLKNIEDKIKLFQDTRQKKHATIENAKDFVSKKRRSKTISVPIEKYEFEKKQFNQKTDLMGIDFELMRDTWQSDHDCEEKLAYKRQGAQDLYNIQYCENIVNEKLEKHKAKISDQMNVMYKRLEGCINLEDPSLSYIQKHFEFKSQIVRDVKNPRFIMENFFPVDKQKEQTKNYRKNQKVSGFSFSFALVFLHF